MASKARELADVIGTQDTTENVLQGRRNLIINGAMQVWQRGTSFSSTNGTCTVDRFKVASGVGTASQSTDVPDGFKYSLYIQSPTTGYTIRHIIEDSYRILSTNTFTISFYIKGDSAFTGEINVNDGTSQTYSVTTDWTRVSKTFSALTSTSAAYGTENDYFDICDGASVSYKVTGVQLEVGSVATPFEHRSYGEELALCQRYYQTTEGSTFNAMGSGVCRATTQAHIYVPFLTTMRANPTTSYVGTPYVRAQNDYAVSSLSDVYAGIRNALIYCNIATSSLTVGDGVVIYGDSNAYFIFDAEL